MNFNQYKLKVQTDLANMSSHMKPDDIRKVQDSITKAETIGTFDAISLGLNFHKFRVENRTK